MRGAHHVGEAPPTVGAVAHRRGRPRHALPAGLGQGQPLGRPEIVPAGQRRRLHRPALTLESAGRALAPLPIPATLAIGIARGRK